MVPNSSPSHCTHEQICIWFKWAIVPDYNVCDGILVKTNTIITLDIEHTSKTGNILNFKLSPSAPQISSPLPLHLLNYMINSVEDSKYIRLHQGSFYAVGACDLNNPIPGLLGDMQVGLGNEESVYPKWAVDRMVRKPSAQHLSLDISAA